MTLSINYIFFVCSWFEFPAVCMCVCVFVCVCVCVCVCVGVGMYVPVCWSVGAEL